MELDEASLEGHWATNANSGVEFFIINDATFSKLCILGSDVEPCFEGASVTDKQISKDFTVKDQFMNTLFTMMNELKDALQYSEGGSSMTEAAEVQETTEVEENTEVEETEFKAEESNAENPISTSFADDEEEGSTGEEGETGSTGEEEESTSDEDETGEKKPRQNHALEEIEAQFVKVQAELEAAQKELKELREFKLGIENQQKEELIAKYHMLSDEARQEISDHKNEYTIEEIESNYAIPTAFMPFLAYIKTK